MIKLRPYQQECVDKVNNLPKGSRSVVVLATGMGKTVTGANFKIGKRMLWLSHRDELVRQPEKYFMDLGYSYGIEKADEHSNGEDIVSASIQTISRDNRLKQFKEDDFDIIVCDEAHHAAAPTYRKVLSYFKPEKLIGLTATPKRGDNVRLTDVFDDICCSYDLKWGIKNGYLSPIRCVQVSADYDMTKLKKSMGDFSSSSLDEAMWESNDDIVVTKAYMKYCLPKHKQTLIYCPTIKVCKRIYGTMKSMLPDGEIDKVAVIHDKMDVKERRKILRDYGEKKIHCIINCMILTEGADLPDTSVIINNRPSANASLYQQIVGRGTRLAEGKEYCLVIDVLGEKSERREICTAPTLFGIEPRFLPKSVRDEIENGDLLDICESIAEDRAAIAEGTRLLVQIIDFFSQERKNIIKDNRKEGLNKIADVYDEYTTQVLDEEDYDFGDLVVKILPDDEHHYCIPATYKTNIYLSKPDVLNRTVIDMDFPAGELARPIIKTSFISEPIPMDDAIRFVTDVLEHLVVGYYRIKWSKKAREKMGKRPASEKQISKVRHDFYQYGVWRMEKDINMLQASNLIDMAKDMGDLEKRKKKILNDKADMEKKRRGKILENWQNKKLEERSKERRKKQERKDAAKSEMVRIEEAINEVKKRKEIEREKLLQLLKKGEETFIYNIDYKWYNKNRAITDGQISFMQVLYHGIKSKNIRFDRSLDPNSEKDIRALNSGQAGMLIGYLKHITKNLDLPAFDGYYVFQASEFMETVKKIKDIDSDIKRIECTYKLIQNQS